MTSLICVHLVHLWRKIPGALAGISDTSVIIGNFSRAQIALAIAQVCANNLPNNQAE